MITVNALAQYQASSTLPSTNNSTTSKAPAALPAATTAAVHVPPAAETSSETVNLSAAAQALQRGDTLITPQALTYSIPGKSKVVTNPSAGNQTMTSDVAHKKLADKLQAAGIAAEPPFDFKVDANSQHIQVLGNRPDAARIEQLINNDPALQQSLASNTASAATAVSQRPAALYKAIAQTSRSNALATV